MLWSFLNAKLRTNVLIYPVCCGKTVFFMFDSCDRTHAALIAVTSFSSCQLFDWSSLEGLRQNRQFPCLLVRDFLRF